MRVARLGDIVHYTNLGDKDGKYPPEQQAAIVTRIRDNGEVALHIFYPTGQFDMGPGAFLCRLRAGPLELALIAETALALALLAGNVPPGLLDPAPIPLKDPSTWARAIDPNHIITWQHYPQTLTAGQYTQFRLTQHACGCMQVPLAQGSAVLPCKAHDMRLKAIWKKVDAEGGRGW